MFANSFSVTAFPRVLSKYNLKLWTLNLPPCLLLYSSCNRFIYFLSKFVISIDPSFFLWKNPLTPCFCTDTFVRWTYILSNSWILVSYLTVQNRQNPSLNRYAFNGRKEVMRTYKRRSNFFPPIKSGLSMYLYIYFENRKIFFIL